LPPHEGQKPRSAASTDIMDFLVRDPGTVIA
jgi:hypothetical protein